MERRESPGSSLQLDWRRYSSGSDWDHLSGKCNVVPSGNGGELVCVCTWPLNVDRTEPVSLVLVYAASLPHNVVLIRGQIRKRFDQPAGPANHDLLCPCRSAQPKMQTKVALRDISIPAAYFYLMFIAALFQGHHRTQGRPV